MTDPAKDLIARLSELVQQHGNQWRQIAPILAAEGYRDSLGKPFSHNALRLKMSKLHGSSGEPHPKATVASRSRSKSSELVESELSEPSKPSECFEPLPLSMRDLAVAVATVLKEEGLLKSAPPDACSLPKPTPDDSSPLMPPQPERITDRKWEKLAGTCDRELVALFHTERRKLRLSVSGMLEYVLWNFFHCPPLSFQRKIDGQQGAKDEG